MNELSKQCDTKTKFDNFDTALYVHHTHRHTYIQTQTVLLLGVSLEERGGVVPTLIPPWDCDCFLFSLLLNVTSPRICLSVSDWWTVPESWVAEDWSTPGQCSLFCYIWWPEWVNNDHITWIMITRKEQWSHHIMNNVCCTTTDQKLKLCDCKITECVTITTQSTAGLVKNQRWKW